MKLICKYRNPDEIIVYEKAYDPFGGRLEHTYISVSKLSEDKLLKLLEEKIIYKIKHRDNFILVCEQEYLITDIKRFKEEESK